jgi:hypothetical protein
LEQSKSVALNGKQSSLSDPWAGPNNSAWTVRRQSKVTQFKVKKVKLKVKKTAELEAKPHQVERTRCGQINEKSLEIEQSLVEPVQRVTLTEIDHERTNRRAHSVD